jgi:2-dehydro-3-deoxyglucarate aldolase/4-hydroxy-2-oxoheptanedioate aldolase
MGSMNNVETFTQKMRNGELCLGTAITFADPAVSELMAEAGYDFTWIDMEHGPVDIRTALGHVMALRGTNTAPLVRVQWNDVNVIKPVLDLCPAGIIVPMVCSRKEAEAAVMACKYPPLGVRGYGPRRGQRFSAITQPEYLKEADGHTLVLVQIEHVEAVKNLDAILDTPGLDGICVGPNDLSGSMNKLGQLDDPQVSSTIDLIFEKARKTDLFVGVSTGYAATTLDRWFNRGAQWINLNVDWANLFMKSKEVADSFRKAASARAAGATA